ncbi:hypothetical protein CKN86_01035 [Carnobacterium divergens]|uniref:LPXTG cell wall anchor domain-containing protein n=1 Tax=Carnobacterium divergens TaxID=2748 RepID=UPI000D4511B1|nr:LPXTG cell wall anchor domain-containing protein [Carnobacterium divergens]MCO6018511.1 LPXTG cell wall anchor domain-containing protein [Carnobacterium divergens]TFI65168.1 hypothetical protein CKN62_01035 [Carnobacterium divergens]TFI92058.1 hypothetical protein CKN84_01035 [Carnobacterium divergens]TFJ07281.1 hypothetical protein CKN86_01035 [Carnobacterium divergens]TFJ08512.1 hypothetical protein CKN65_01035 [Carnobacterium divergens]
MKKQYLGSIVLFSGLLIGLNIPNQVDAEGEINSSENSYAPFWGSGQDTYGEWIFTTTDGHYIGYKNMFIADLSNSIQFDYIGENTGKMEYRILAEDEVTVLASGAYTNNAVIDLSSYKDGVYYVEVNKYKAPGSIIGPNTNFVQVNKESIDINLTINGNYGKYNPTSVNHSSAKEGATIGWVIKGENGFILEGTGNVTPEQMQTLGDGKYTIETTVTGKTMHGNPLTNKTNDNFEIRHPESTTLVDRPINPESLTGTKKIEDSELTWTIYDKNNQPIATGSGNEVPLAEINALADGEYTVKFTEMSPEAIADTSSGEFKIRRPESTTTVDKPINPESLTGTQKLPDSSLGWVIYDKDGKPVASGLGSEVPSSEVKDLENGEYKIEFTETSTEGSTHSSDGTFKIRRPETTTTVDKPVNPSSVTGTQKLPESSLEWVIYDSAGKKVASGVGNEVPLSEMEGLKDGDYKVEFTETSPEGLTHSSSDKFKLRHPETTTTVDKPVNPESITGTQKHPESNLGWVIYDKEGKPVVSGTGNKVPLSEMEGLKDGDYKVEFTETSPEGLTHSSSDEFKLRHPETTTTVDKPVNPESVTGTQKHPESSLGWVIYDKEGKPVASGKGGKVPQSEMDALADGDYTVAFTETTPEGLTDTSKGKFSINKKAEPKPEEPTQPVAPINPTKPADQGTPIANQKPNVLPEATTSKTETFPQTGETKSKSSFWLAISSFIGMIGLVGVKKRS